MSGVVLFVYGKLRIKGRKERGEAGLKERKKKEVSEGREGGKERKRKSILVFHVGTQSTLLLDWDTGENGGEPR